MGKQLIEKMLTSESKAVIIRILNGDNIEEEIRYTDAIKAVIYLISSHNYKAIFTDENFIILYRSGKIQRNFRGVVKKVKFIKELQLAGKGFYEIIKNLDFQFIRIRIQKNASYKLFKDKKYINIFFIILYIYYIYYIYIQTILYKGRLHKLNKNNNLAGLDRFLGFSSPARLLKNNNLDKKIEIEKPAQFVIDLAQRDSKLNKNNNLAWLESIQIMGYSTYYLSILNKINYLQSKLDLAFILFELKARSTQSSPARLLKNNNLDKKTSNPLDDKARSYPKEDASLLKNNNLDNQELKLDVSVTNPGNGSKSKLSVGLSSKEISKIKELKKKERKEINQTVTNLVDYLMLKIKEYNNSIGAKSYFPRDWVKVNKKHVRSLLKEIPENKIIEAVDWFFTNEFWRGKVDNYQIISRHFTKFLSSSNKINNKPSIKDVIN